MKEVDSGSAIAFAGCFAALLIGMPPFHAYARDALTSLRLPDSMQVQVVGSDLRLHGVAAQILAFESSESVDALAAYFNALWDGRMARSQAQGWDVLAHQDDGQLTTVQMQSLPLGATAGYIARTDLPRAVEEGRRVPAPGIPVLSGTEVLQDIEADDLGRLSRTLLLISTRSAHENLEFYRAHFREEGFEPLSYGSLTRAEGGGAMLLNRGAEQMNVVVSESEGNTLVTIVNVRN